MLRKIIQNKVFATSGEQTFSGELNSKSKKQRNKIAIVIDTAIEIPPAAGVPYRLYNLSKALQRRNNQVVWIICNRNFQDKRNLKNLLRAEVKTYLLDKDSFYNPKYIAKILQNENIDVAQYEITQTFIDVGLPVRRLTKIPAILECHDVEATLRETLGRKEEAPLLEYLQFVAGQCADGLVSMTPTDYKTLVKKIQAPEDKMFLAPNGVSKNQVKSPINKRAIKQMVFLGNLHYPPNKEAALFIANKIFPEVKKAIPEVKMIFIGMVPDDLEKQLEKTRGVRVTGRVKDDDKFAELLTKSDMGLCTVRSGSGMKVKILDYSLAGLPIISTSIGASGYEKLDSLIIEDEKDCIIESCVGLLENPKRAIEIGKKNQKQVLNNYSWKSISDTMEDVYRLARSFDLRGLEKVKSKPFWLEEEREKNSLLQGNYLIDNNISNYENNT